MTVQEAVSNKNVGRNIAVLPWRVIDRLNLFGGNVIKIEGLNKTYVIAYPDQRAGFIHLDRYSRHAADVGIVETVRIREAGVKDAKTVEFQITQAGSAIEADAGVGPARELGHGDNTTSPMQARPGKRLKIWKC